MGENTEHEKRAGGWGAERELSTLKPAAEDKASEHRLAAEAEFRTDAALETDSQGKERRKETWVPAVASISFHGRMCLKEQPASIILSWVAMCPTTMWEPVSSGHVRSPKKQ